MATRIGIGLLALGALALALATLLGDDETMRPVGRDASATPGPGRTDADGGAVAPALLSRDETVIRQHIPLPASSLAMLGPPSSKREGPPPPVLDGPVTRAHYADGTLEYEGAQVLNAQGVWVRQGPWRAWYENGQMHERGDYFDDREAGPWEWWYENGERMSVGQFEDGRREGFWRYWHENGALMTECHYANGKAHGLWTQYHPDGFKMAEGRFSDGELEGDWIVWNEDGTLNLDGTGSYAEGDKVE